MRLRLIVFAAFCGAAMSVVDALPAYSQEQAGVTAAVRGRVEVALRAGAMSVRMPTGVIGIRGTIAIGRVDQVEQSGRMVDRQQVILVGPGADTESNRRGGIALEADCAPGAADPQGRPGAACQRITIWRPGYGSTLTGDGQWGPVAQVPPAQVQEVMRLLQARGAAVGAPDAGNIRNAGDKLFDGRRVVSRISGLHQIITTSNLLDNQASQPDRMELGTFASSTGIIDGLADFADLRTLSSGQFYYTQANVPLNETAMNTQIGSYNLFMNINFGTRTIGGGDSRAEINIPDFSLSGTALFATPQSFAGGSGPASFVFIEPIPSLFCSQGCQAQLTAQTLNQAGVVAQSLSHSLNVTDGGFPIATGSGITDGRAAGTAPAPQ